MFNFGLLGRGDRCLTLSSQEPVGQGCLLPIPPSTRKQAGRQYRLVFGGRLEFQLGSRTRGWLCESAVVSQSPILTSTTLLTPPYKGEVRQAEEKKHFRMKYLYKDIGYRQAERLISKPLLQQTSFLPALEKSASCCDKYPLTGDGDNRTEEQLNCTELKWGLVRVSTES